MFLNFAESGKVLSLSTRYVHWLPIFKVAKSVYLAKLGQQYDKELNNFLLHVPNNALKNIYMLYYRTVNNTNSLYCSSIEVLIVINSFSFELLMVALIFSLKVV